MATCFLIVTPAEARLGNRGVQGVRRRWIPASAGMTEAGAGYFHDNDGP
ncbi:MAG: hypothetical protein OXQ27_03610 [Chloroflexota bacterium]|nr:hypothetical protein [Chloroflexota bacterium]